MTDDRHYNVSVSAGAELEGTDCVVLHADGNVEPATTAHAIATGGAGVVYRAHTKRGMDVAIKLLSPRTEIVAEIDSPAFQQTFDREIGILSGVTHTRVAKILFSGTTPLHGDDIPFYAMEYIEGQRFDEFIVGSSLDGLAFLQLVDQVLDGVEYLHERRIMHADLKGENILVREQFGHYDAKIVDLGVAKVLDAGHRGSDDVDATLLDSDTGTYFYSSRRITREEWRPRLGKRITRAQLHEMFPSHDLFALGVLIGDAISHEQLRRRLVSDLGRSGVSALEQVRRRLARPPGSEHYGTVKELRSDWQKLHPRYLAPLGIAELALGAQAETSVATPSGQVGLTDRTTRVINHPLVQRLRNIPQLELVQLVYPGATHTRLLHSLNTFDIARIFILNLLRDPSFRLLVDPAGVQACLLSALCHDVGHFPLSHMFEDWSAQQQRAGEPRTVPTDDDLFWAFVDPESAAPTFEPFANAIHERLPAGVPALHDFLFAKRLFPEGVLTALRELKHLHTPSARLLRGLLDSPIDADKVSYLTDDSTMTGVRYGHGIDLEALFAALRAPREVDLPDTPEPLVAINDKGLPAVEQMMLARYWMLRRVYWHHTHRAAMGMVKHVISTLHDHGGLDLVDYFGHTLFRGPQDGLRYLSDALAERVRTGALDEQQVDPLAGLEDAGRTLYKRILTFARGDGGTYGEVFELLAARSGTALLAVGEAVRTELASQLGENVAPGEVIIDVPVRERGRARTPVLVYLQKRPDHPEYIEDASPVISQLMREFDVHVRKARVFVHPRLVDPIRARGTDTVRTAVVAVLQGR